MDIIGSMGSFEHEKNILKRYARRGQCFSTTKQITQIAKERIFLYYPDISRNGHEFSDGCGIIHPDLASQIARIHKFQQTSAFQIRIGGAKGVLVVGNDEKLFEKEEKKEDEGNYQILLRKSQIKFPSDNFSLDIVRCATFSLGFLNR